MVENGDGSAGAILEEVRRLSTPRGRARSHRFAIEGYRLHERALRAGVRVERAIVGRSLCQEKAGRGQRLLGDLEASGCRVVPVDDARISELTGGRSIGAILGVVEMPAAIDLKELLEAAERSAFLLVAVDVSDPGNVGAMVRTALASGATALAAVGTSDPYHPRAVRTSMGSVFKLPIARYEDCGPLLGHLTEVGALTIGAVSAGGASPSSGERADRPAALFVGSEAFGLSPELSGALDRLVTIPMVEGVDSLSVNAVAAVLLYEIRRRADPADG